MLVLKPDSDIIQNRALKITINSQGRGCQLAYFAAKIKEPPTILAQVPLGRARKASF